MSGKTQEWTERVGREAVELGFTLESGAACLVPGGVSRVGIFCSAAEALAPDFRDRLTELACIAWLEDVAREVYGGLAELDFQIAGPASKSRYRVTVAKGGTNVGDWRMRVDARAPTLAEACIEAVCAMKGGGR